MRWTSCSFFKLRSLRAAGALVLFASLASLAFAGGSSSFALDWKKELAIGLPGAALFAYGTIATRDAPDSGRAFGWPDERWTFPYNATLDKIGDLSQFAAMAALPLLLDSFSLNEAATVAVMYFESALWTVGLKDTLKSMLSRERPYLSRADSPAELAADEDRFYSFPSGHSAFAFMTASFATYVYSRGSASPLAKTLVGAGAFAAAAGTAVLRVGGGVHFTGDVLAGALIGSAIGALVPWIHERSGENWKIALGPDTIAVSYSY